MEFSFDIFAVLGLTTAVGEACVGRLDRAKIQAVSEKSASGSPAPELWELLEAVSVKSAADRGLEEEERPPGIQASEDDVYVLVEGRFVLGYARVGVRELKALPPQAGGGYSSYGSSLRDIRPPCLVDFYVVGELRRRRLGRLLLDAVLAERSLGPGRLAYSRPSPALVAFLARHYALDEASGKCRMASCYLLFDDFFGEASAERPAAVKDAAPDPRLTASVSAGSPADEPKIEEELEDDGVTDPLASYHADGEENFYTQRAKLFCFNDGQWQDAGGGQATLLRHGSRGTMRLIFVQDGGRVIANHFIANVPGHCELQRHTSGNEKTWMWLAKERIGERRFALRFKSVPDANEFKEVFERARRQAATGDAVEYVVLRKVGATAERNVNSPHVRLVAAGSVVTVIEVAYLAEERRVRGKLLEPPSWITLLSHSSADAGSYAVMRKDLESFRS